MSVRREDEIDEIERFIAEHGVTPGPLRCAGVVRGAIPLAEERRRMVALEVARSSSAAERREAQRRLYWADRRGKRGGGWRRVTK